MKGFVAEFGVQYGDTLRLIAGAYNGPVHGFDSFKGLPADWGNQYKAGDLSTGGKLPEGIDKAVYHVGWFADTIPPFLEQNNQYARFIHVDGDLYSSARDVLYGLADRIVPGTVIVFDNYFWSQWLDMEHKALMEFSLDYGVKYSFFGVSYIANSVGIIIEGKNPKKVEGRKGWFPTAHVGAESAGHDWTDTNRF